MTDRDQRNVWAAFCIMVAAWAAAAGVTVAVLKAIGVW